MAWGYEADDLETTWDNCCLWQSQCVSLDTPVFYRCWWERFWGALFLLLSSFKLVLMDDHVQLLIYLFICSSDMEKWRRRTSSPFRKMKMTRRHILSCTGKFHLKNWDVSTDGQALTSHRVQMSTRKIHLVTFLQIWILIAEPGKLEALASTVYCGFWLVKISPSLLPVMATCSLTGARRILLHRWVRPRHQNA